VNQEARPKFSLHETGKVFEVKFLGSLNGLYPHAYMEKIRDEGSYCLSLFSNVPNESRSEKAALPIMLIQITKNHIVACRPFAK
jgi:hypothetical protein